MNEYDDDDDDDVAAVSRRGMLAVVDSAV